MKTICIPLLVIASAVSAAEPRELVGKYQNCVIDNAKRLGTGIDPADVVARAALIPCRPLRAVIVTSFGLADAASAQAGEWAANQADQQAIEWATLAILEARAKK